MVSSFIALFDINSESAAIGNRMLGCTLYNDRKSSSAKHPSLPAVFFTVSNVVSGAIYDAGITNHRNGKQHVGKLAHEFLIFGCAYSAEPRELFSHRPDVIRMKWVVDLPGFAELIVGSSY